MISYKKNIFWNVIFNYTPIVFALFTGLFFVPLYLEKIPKILYGAWLATGNVLAILTIVDPGFNILLQQKIAVNNGADNKSLIGKYIISGIILALMISLMITFLGLTYLYVYDPSFSFTTNIQIEEYRNAFLIGLFGTSLMVFSFTFSSINQGLMSSFYVGVIYLFSSIISIITSFLLLKNGFGLISLAIVQLTTGALLSIGNFFLLFRKINKLAVPLSWDKNNFISIIKLSTSSFFARALNVFSLNLDLIILAKYLNPTIVTQISITKKVPELSKSFIERPGISLMPSLGHMFGVGQNTKNLKNISIIFINTLIWLSGFVFTSVLIFNKSFITVWVGTTYFAGNVILLLLCMNYMIQLLISSVNNLTLSINESFNYINNLSIMQSIVSIIFMFLGFYFFGISGLFLAPVVSGIFFLLFFIKRMFLTYNYTNSDFVLLAREFFNVVIISSVALIVFYFLNFNSWKLLVTCVFAFFLFFLFFLFILSKNFRFLLYRINIFQSIKSKFYE